eukprot:PhM_4_TR18761/c1_g1_i1/m.98967
MAQKAHEDFCGVSVAVRVRPRLPRLGEVHTECCFPVMDESTLTMVVPGKANPNTKSTMRYKFDFVFAEEDTQQVVYDTCTVPLVDSVLQGGFGTVIAYGQTGSGKTHTILGSLTKGFHMFSPFEQQQLRECMVASKRRPLETPPELSDGINVADVYRMIEKHLRGGDYEKVIMWYLNGMNKMMFPPPKTPAHRDPNDIQHLEFVLQQRSRVDVDYTINENSGIFLRLVADILSYKYNNRRKLKVVLQLSIIEIYMDEVMDLLNNRQKLTVRDSGQKLDLFGLSSVSIDNVHSLMHWFHVANSFRSMRATMKSDLSSRSHAIFKIRLKQEKCDMTDYPDTAFDDPENTTTFTDQFTDIETQSYLHPGPSPGPRSSGGCARTATKSRGPKSAKSGMTGRGGKPSSSKMRSKTPAVAAMNGSYSTPTQPASRKAMSAVRASPAGPRHKTSNLLFDVPWEFAASNSDDIMHSCITLADLAGSERGMDMTGVGAAESKHINTSLCALGRVICNLHSRHGHINFRDSKLTQLLRSSFTAPNSNVLLIAALSPVTANAPNSLSTLKFCDQVKALIPGESYDDTDLAPQRAYLSSIRTWQSLCSEMRLLKETVSLTSTDLWSPRRVQKHAESQEILKAHYFLAGHPGTSQAATPRPSSTPSGRRSGPPTTRGKTATKDKRKKPDAHKAALAHHDSELASHNSFHRDDSGHHLGGLPHANVQLGPHEEIIPLGPQGNDVIGLMTTVVEQDKQLAESNGVLRELTGELSTLEDQLVSSLGPSGASTANTIQTLQDAATGNMSALESLFNAVANKKQKAFPECVCLTAMMGVLRDPKIAAPLLNAIRASKIDRTLSAFVDLEQHLLATIGSPSVTTNGTIVADPKPTAPATALALHAVRETRDKLRVLALNSPDERTLRWLSPVLPMLGGADCPAALKTKLAESMWHWWYEPETFCRLPIQCSGYLISLLSTPQFALTQPQQQQVFETLHGVVSLGGFLAEPRLWRCVYRCIENRVLSHEELTKMIFMISNFMKTTTRLSDKRETLEVIGYKIIPLLRLPYVDAEYKKKNLNMLGWKQPVVTTTEALISAMLTGSAADVACPALLTWLLLFWCLFGQSMQRHVLKQCKGTNAFGAVLKRTLEGGAPAISVERTLVLLPKLDSNDILTSAVQHDVIATVCRRPVKDVLPSAALKTFLTALGSWAQKAKPSVKGAQKDHLKAVVGIASSGNTEGSLQAFLQTL